MTAPKLTTAPSSVFIVDITRSWAVLIPDAHPFAGNAIHGLRPRDRDEFPLTPLSHPQKRLAQTIRAEEGLGGHSDHLAILHMGVQNAPAAAVAASGGVNDLFLAHGIQPLSSCLSFTLFYR